jgi:23S rRNA pseudouridine2605 synthase
MTDAVRLQKHLARAGVASRRAAEALIEAGRVRVNGEVVRELGTRIDAERDRIEVDGRAVVVGPVEWVALNKPPGFVCTRDDPRGRRTVYDLLPPALRSLFTVGRLDADSEGLLLLTNDGDAANRLLHPRYGVRREYTAVVEGRPDSDTVARLERGVELEDGLARAEAVKLATTGAGATVTLTLTEGRKREVRRMLAAVGHPARSLRRVRYDGIVLGTLEPGEWRRLEPREIADFDRGRAGSEPADD